MERGIVSAAVKSVAGMHCCIQKERRQAAVRQVGTGEAIFSVTGNKIQRVGREEDFSNLTDHIFAGG